jgi:hypothetical protein
MIIIERKCTYTATNKPKITWLVKGSKGTIIVFKTKRAAIEYSRMIDAWDDTLKSLHLS